MSRMTWTGIYTTLFFASFQSFIYTTTVYWGPETFRLTEQSLDIPHISVWSWSELFLPLILFFSKPLYGRKTWHSTFHNIHFTRCTCKCGWSLKRSWEAAQSWFWLVWKFLWVIYWQLANQRTQTQHLISIMTNTIYQAQCKLAWGYGQIQIMWCSGIPNKLIRV